MPGHFGVDPSEDGGYAECGSSAHVGLFGNNTSTDPTAGGGAGGAGVFGLTLSVNAAGVFGANNGTGGVGVQGKGPDVGVSGFSEKGNGLRGFSNEGDALYAATQSSAHTGVFGNNTSSAAATGGGYGGSGGLRSDGRPRLGGGPGCQQWAERGGCPGQWSDGGGQRAQRLRSRVLAHSDHGDGSQGFAHDSAANGIHGHNDATTRRPRRAPLPATGCSGTPTSRTPAAWWGRSRPRTPRVRV